MRNVNVKKASSEVPENVLSCETQIAICSSIRLWADSVEARNSERYQRIRYIRRHFQSTGRRRLSFDDRSESIARIYPAGTAYPPSADRAAIIENGGHK